MNILYIIFDIICIILTSVFLFIDYALCDDMAKNRRSKVDAEQQLAASQKEYVKTCEETEKVIAIKRNSLTRKKEELSGLKAELKRLEQAGKEMEA